MLTKELSIEEIRRKSRLRKNIKKDIVGHLFILPVIISLLVFTLYPMLMSFYYSFFDYSVISPPTNFGLHNYLRPFSEYVWPTFSKSITVTLIYTVIAVPTNIVLSYMLALLLNQKFKGMKVFRTLFYIPTIIPAVISGLMWKDITNVEFGIANAIFSKVGLPLGTFLSAANTAMPTFIMIGMFGLGGGMILWMAQMNNIPETMYEAAKIDGAGFWMRTLKITIPLSTPMIFYNVVLNSIGALQTCAGVFVLTNGSQGPGNSLLFYVVNVYFAAFQSYSMGAACALSWMLFAVIAVLTGVMFKTSKWVEYGE